MGFKDTLFSFKQTINCGGTLLDFKSPLVMGILNLTPDSFYDGNRYRDASDIVNRVARMLSEGADIIDIGAFSSRPGAAVISEEEEKERLKPALLAIRKQFPQAILSVDTCRSGIAGYAIQTFGVHMINDISAGIFDADMIPLVGSFRVPYVMMHMRGTPQTMQKDIHYEDIIRDLMVFFAGRIALARKSGIEDIIMDPGFGFGKTLDDNYRLLRELKLFELLGRPIMVGVSRKSMIYKTLQLSPDEALNGTTAIHMLALHNGANLLRVHDVKEAVQTVRLFMKYRNQHNSY